MLNFYDVDENYIAFLKQYDRQVPDIKYDNNNKFVCGIVLKVNGIDYYAPISHLKDKQQTNIQIYNENRVISTIRFSFMFPALSTVLTKKDFSVIAKTDPKYADLLQAEYLFCSKYADKIHKKAETVYQIGCNKGHRLNYVCCDFKLLEQHYKEYGMQ